MSVGNRVKTVRKALGISQEKFGNQIGISKVAISDIENEKHLLQSVMQDLFVVNLILIISG